MRMESLLQIYLKIKIALAPILYRFGPGSTYRSFLFFIIKLGLFYYLSFYLWNYPSKPIEEILGPRIYNSGTLGQRRYPESEMSVSFEGFSSTERTTIMNLLGRNVHEVMPKENQNWNSSATFIKWDQSETKNLHEYLSQIERRISKTIIILLPKSRLKKLKKVNNSIEFVPHDFNSPNSVYSKEEMEVFHFVNTHRRWEMEFYISIEAPSNDIYLRDGFSRILPEYIPYMLKGLPVSSKEYLAILALDSNQKWGNCAVENYPYVTHTHHGCGLACAIHWMHFAMSYSFRMHMSLRVLTKYHKRHVYLYTGGDCPYNDYRCQFLPIPACPIPIINQTEPHYVEICDLNCRSRDVCPFGSYSVIPSNGVGPICTSRGEYRIQMAAGGRRVDAHYTFWWRGIINRYMLHPNPSAFAYMREAFDDMSNRAGTNDFFPCISLQIRRGDAVNEDRLYLPEIDTYTNRVKKYLQKTSSKTKRLFLLTDDPLIVSTVKQQLPDMQVFKMSEKKGKLWGEYDYLDGIEVLTEVAFASRCEHFIGSFDSNMGRLVAEIMVIRGGTFESIDSDWFLEP